MTRLFLSMLLALSCLKAAGTGGTTHTPRVATTGATHESSELRNLDELLQRHTKLNEIISEHCQTYRSRDYAPDRLCKALDAKKLITREPFRLIRNLTTQELIGLNYNYSRLSKEWAQIKKRVLALRQVVGKTWREEAELRDKKQRLALYKQASRLENIIDRMCAQKRALVLSYENKLYSTTREKTALLSQRVTSPYQEPVAALIIKTFITFISHV